MMRYPIVGANIDTWLINVKGKLPDGSAEELDFLKEASQEADEDLPTRWTFAGETLFIRAHGSGRQWRWILHCPSLHLDIGRGKLNHIIGKARLSAAFLWEHELGDALHLLYSFLVDFYGEGFMLQVSEVHLCADIAGWELSLDDAPAFITRGHRRKTHTEGERCRRHRGGSVRPSGTRAEHDGQTLHRLRVQQRRSALLHDLRQDQRNHSLAQGLDAGGLAQQRLGRRSPRDPRRVPLQAGMSQGARR